MNKKIKIPKKIEYSKKIKEIYNDKNKYDIYEMIKKDINFNFLHKYKDKGITYIETTNSIVYKFLDNKLLNIFSKEKIDKEGIINKLSKENIKISIEVLNKFQNIPIEKINEIIKCFLSTGFVNKANDEYIYIENKLEEVVLVFDCYNLYLENIIKNNFEIIDEGSYLGLEKDKIKVIEKNMKDIDKNKNLKEQIIYLDSYNYNIDNYKNDIKSNFKNYNKLNNLDNYINIYTDNYTYTIINYNIVSIKDKNGLPLPTQRRKNKRLKINLIEIEKDFEIKEEYICNNTIQNLYGNFIKAQEYLQKTGLSIRILTKFITENNFKELFDFIISDIIYYGVILYEDYIDENLIIVTNRFCYIIQKNIIVDIKFPSTKEIKECSLPFKPILNNKIKKDKILDLDIKDKIRDFITYENILSLKIGDHAKQRFNERISKNDDFKNKDGIYKNDIYKNGEVMLGTYYLNSKLVRGKKYVYVLTNNEIVSIWKKNDFIENLNNRYFNKLEKIN